MKYKYTLSFDTCVNCKHHFTCKKFKEFESKNCICDDFYFYLNKIPVEGKNIVKPYLYMVKKEHKGNCNKKGNKFLWIKRQLKQILRKIF